MDEKPIKHVFVFTPNIGIEHFLVHLDGRHLFAPTPSVGVVHIWVDLDEGKFLRLPPV